MHKIENQVKLLMHQVKQQHPIKVEVPPQSPPYRSRIMKRGMNTTWSPTAAKKCKQMRSFVMDAGQSWSDGTANAQKTAKRVLTSRNSFCNSYNILYI